MSTPEKWKDWSHVSGTTNPGGLPQGAMVYHLKPDALDQAFNKEKYYIPAGGRVTVTEYDLGMDTAFSQDVDLVVTDESENSLSGVADGIVEVSVRKDVAKKGRVCFWCGKGGGCSCHIDGSGAVTIDGKALIETGSPQPVWVSIYCRGCQKYRLARQIRGGTDLCDECKERQVW